MIRMLSYCHSRLVYCSRGLTNQRGNLGNITSAVDVAVSQDTTVADKPMPSPDTDLPTLGARLRGIGWVDVDDPDTNSLRLVCDETLQLTPHPAMQASSHTLSCLDAVSDVRQVFHCYRRGFHRQRFFHDSFARLVIDVSDVPLLPAGDFAEHLSCALRAVGLETTAQRKMAASLVTQPATAAEFAGARSREVVISDIHAQDWSWSHQRTILNFDNQVKVPLALAADQFCLSGRASSQKLPLIFTDDHPHRDTPCQRIERHGITSERVGALVKVHARPAKVQDRDRGLCSYPAKLFLRPVRLTHRKDGITGHLRAQGRFLPEATVHEVDAVQPDSSSDVLSRRKGADCMHRRRQPAKRSIDWLVPRSCPI